MCHKRAPAYLRRSGRAGISRQLARLMHLHGHTNCFLRLHHGQVGRKQSTSSGCCFGVLAVQACTIQSFPFTLRACGCAAHAWPHTALYARLAAFMTGQHTKTHQLHLCEVLVATCWCAVQPSLQGWHRSLQGWHRSLHRVPSLGHRSIMEVNEDESAYKMLLCFGTWKV